jgi:predicted phage terminase large subunit-like protein
MNDPRLETALKDMHDDLCMYFKGHLAGQDWHREAWYHRRIADILTKERGNFAVEAFRQSGKSSIVLRSFPCWALSYPDPRTQYIVIVRQNQGLAEESLRGIVRDFTTNQVMSLPLIKVNRQAAQSFDVTVRGPQGPMDVVIEAYGKGSALRGLLHGALRPSIVILDDIQSYEDSLSDSTQEKDWEWFLSDVKPLGKDTRIFIIGNNLGQKCVIERIFRFQKELGFQTLRIPIMDQDGVPAWPEVFPKKWIDEERESNRLIGKLDIWHRERMCVAMDEESRCFRQSQFRYWDSLPILKRIAIAVDPAISKRARADYTGISVAGIDGKNHIYVLETVKKKMLPDEIIDEVFRLQKKWGGTVGMEDVQYQRMLILETRKQMALRNRFFNLIELKARGEKEARIRASLQPRFQAIGISHRKEMSDLEYELLAFPNGMNDDVIDSLANAVTMLSPQGKGEYLSYQFPSGSSKSDLEEVFSGADLRNPLRPIYRKQ